jgi:hypothetical protein
MINNDYTKLLTAVNVKTDHYLEPGDLFKFNTDNVFVALNRLDPVTSDILEKKYTSSGDTVIALFLGVYHDNTCIYDIVLIDNQIYYASAVFYPDNLGNPQEINASKYIKLA